MVKKISRRKFLKDHPDFPQADHYHNKFRYPDNYGQYILYTEARSAPELCRKVSRELVKLADLLNLEDIAFQGDSSVPWLFRTHDYRPVKRAQEYLSMHNVSRQFNGALQPARSGLCDFIEHLFWLVRCNGVLAIPHFTDKGYNIMASICQYGNIHLATLNKQTDDMFNDVLSRTKLTKTDRSRCSGRVFGRTTAI